VSPLNIQLQRIPFNATVDSRMRTLKAKTGITPNVLARFGFCLSLEAPGAPADPFETEGTAREINRNTLVGVFDETFSALLRTWVATSMPGRTLGQKDFDKLFVAHMNRGFEILSARMRYLGDLRKIVPAA